MRTASFNISEFYYKRSFVTVLCCLKNDGILLGYERRALVSYNLDPLGILQFKECQTGLKKERHVWSLWKFLLVICMFGSSSYIAVKDIRVYTHTHTHTHTHVPLNCRLLELKIKRFQQTKRLQTEETEVNKIFRQFLLWENKYLSFI